MRKIRKCMVAGHTFKVVWKDLKTAGEDGGALFGCCDVDEKVIYIEQTITSHKVARDTICHEATHAVLELSGLKHLPGFEEIEEAVVRAIDYLYLPAVDDITKRLNR